MNTTHILKCCFTKGSSQFLGFVGLHGSDLGFRVQCLGFIVGMRGAKTNTGEELPCRELA